MNNGYYVTSLRSGEELGVDEKIALHIRVFGNYYNMKHVQIPENVFKRKYMSKLPFGRS